MTTDGSKHQKYLDRLSALLDDELNDAARRDVEGHLASCPSCARVAAELEHVRTAAAALGPIEPSRDLWPRLQARLREPDVLPLPGSVPERRVSPWRRRVRLTIPQLAAAGLVLMLASGAGAWSLRATAEGAPEASGFGAGSDVRQASTDATGQGDEMSVGATVDAFEAILDEARDRLDPNTIRILEKNLAVIDRAIAEARAALEVDPGNDFLQDHLRANEERRLEYLRQTRSLVEWSS